MDRKILVVYMLYGCPEWKCILALQYWKALTDDEWIAEVATSSYNNE